MIKTGRSQIIERLPQLDYRCYSWNLSKSNPRGCPFCASNDSPLFLRPDNLSVTFCHQCHCFYVAVTIPEEELLNFYQQYWRLTCPRNLTDEMSIYLLSTAAKRFSRDACLNKMTQIVGALSGKRILDVGCGFGEKSTMMKSQGASVIGIDISHAAVCFCKDKLGIATECTSIETFSEKNNSFDIVTMFEFIEHPIEPLNALKAALKIMKNGAYLVIVTPNGTAGERWLNKREKEWIGFQVDLEHMQYLHVDTLDYLCHKLNCRLVHLEQLGHRATDAISERYNTCSPAKLSTRIKKYIKKLPGSRRTIYAYRDFESLLKSALHRTSDTGDYHLFAILQKIS